MTKDEWIREQYNAATEKNIALFTSALNTQSLAANPMARATVPRVVNFTEIVNSISSTDLLVFYKDYAAIVEAIIENIAKNSLADVANLLRALSTSSLSQQTKDYMNSKFQEIAASYQDPVTHGVLDPNWQPQIMASPAELAGYGLIYRNEIEEALP